MLHSSGEMATITAEATAVMECGKGIELAPNPVDIMTEDILIPPGRAHLMADRMDMIEDMVMMPVEESAVDRPSQERTQNAILVRDLNLRREPHHLLLGVVATVIAIEGLIRRLGQVVIDRLKFASTNSLVKLNTLTNY
jgi:hypothetical protein